jgi:hypothetical protein
VFSTLKLHNQYQVNFQDFSATSYNAVHDSPLPPASSYAFSYRISPESCGFTAAGSNLEFLIVLITFVELDVAAAVV